ncbi:hypothetical protein OG21DRAFT_206022 [Imleria badia]|nr:hypothetical protein OG21DRAFT_206022 [Imleria badia]
MVGYSHALRRVARPKTASSTHSWCPCRAQTLPMCPPFPHRLQRLLYRFGDPNCLQHLQTRLTCLVLLPGSSGSSGALLDSTCSSTDPRSNYCKHSREKNISKTRIQRRLQLNWTIVSSFRVSFSYVLDPLLSALLVHAHIHHTLSHHASTSFCCYAHTFRSPCFKIKSVIKFP